MKAAVILSGCGVFDGSEIHEAVFSLLALAENRVEYSIFAPDKDQYHVINHTSGEEQEEKRNILVESARIARGEISPLSELKAGDFDLLVIPGGFGAAKNLNQWAISGPSGEINSEVKETILSFLDAQKVICALCMGPTVVAKALEGSSYAAALTVGTTQEPSPYDIAGIHEGMESIGSTTVEKTKKEVQIDTNLKIVTAPCYMMEAGILDVRRNAKLAVEKAVSLL
jgi:enhancing lycopene biosynthesis protein 2